MKTKATRAMNRREFARSTVAAGVLAPWILPSAVWGAEGTAKPGERLTMGFIGMGTQNRGLLSGFLRRKEVQVVAVCDVDTTRREHSKKTVDDHYAKQTEGGTYKGCAAYNDFREVVGRADIDAVCIATPDHWHALIVVAAAKAKKDIYCEKPLSLTIREAREMVKAVRANDRVLQTGSMQRSSREFWTACGLVRNGAIGKISHVDVSVGPSSKWCDLTGEPVEPGLDWNLWLGPAPERAYNSILSPRGVHKHFPDWRNYREYSGGMMTDWGAHHFDIAQWGLGMDESGPVDIIPPEDPKAQYGLKYVYANGVEVHHRNGNGVVFYGSEGKIHVNRGKFEMWLGEERKASDLQEGLAWAEKNVPEPKVKLYSSKDHSGDFLECVRSRKRPICDVEVGARSVTVCHLGNLAYWNRRKLRWDPVKEEFVGDEEANRWRDVPRRDPWVI